MSSSLSSQGTEEEENVEGDINLYSDRKWAKIERKMRRMERREKATKLNRQKTLMKKFHFHAHKDEAGSPGFRSQQTHSFKRRKTSFYKSMTTPKVSIDRRYSS